MDFGIDEMQKMQIKLQNKYKDKWEPICPETGKNKLLWMIGEIGEVIDIARKNVWTVAKNTWEKGLTYAFRDRRNKKRNFRALWIQRINAAARLEGMSYSKLMGGLHKAGIEITVRFWLI